MAVAAAWLARVWACVVWLPACTVLNGRCLLVFAPDDDDLVPREVEDVGGGARGVGDGVGAQVSDPLVHVELAVGADDQQSVAARAACGEGAEADSDARDLGAVAPTREPLLRFPVEQLAAQVERLADVRAGERSLPGPQPAIAVRCVDLADLETVEVEFAARPCRPTASSMATICAPPGSPLRRTAAACSSGSPAPRNRMFSG